MMTSKNNTQNHNEIDLTIMILIIWNNIWKILIITSLAMLITYVSQITKVPIKKIYNTKTEIRPISTFDEEKYSFYNSYIAKLDAQAFLNEYSESDFLGFTSIEKSFLIKLFIDKLNQNTSYIDAIKKFKLVQKKKLL